MRIHSEEWALSERVQVLARSAAVAPNQRAVFGERARLRRALGGAAARGPRQPAGRRGDSAGHCGVGLRNSHEDRGRIRCAAERKIQLSHGLGCWQQMFLVGLEFRILKCCIETRAGRRD